ncbi:MAG: hypothetical protein IPI19_09485 [Ignavibacteriales bacterium]|nr:hypothetical protein [Ignavibacteriales bacterium]
MNFRKDGALWFVFAYQMLTIGSSFGILLSGLFLFTFIKKPLHLISILLLIVFIYYIGLKYEFIPLVRLNAVLQALNLFNPDFDLLVEVDHSAAVRVVPTIMALQSLEFFYRLLEWVWIFRLITSLQ